MKVDFFLHSIVKLVISVNAILKLYFVFSLLLVCICVSAL